MEVLAKVFALCGAFPGGRVIRNKASDTLQGIRFGVPDAAAEKTLARLNMDIERRRRNLMSARVEKTRATPGLVGRLVVGKTRVAINAKQRAAVFARVSAVMLADLGDRLL